MEVLVNHGKEFGCNFDSNGRLLGGVGGLDRGYDMVYLFSKANLTAFIHPNIC